MDDAKDWGALVRLLVEAAGDRVADLGHPIWVRVLDPPGADKADGFALGFCDEPDALMGWVATSDCQAVGMIGTGRLRPIAGPPSGARLHHRRPGPHGLPAGAGWDGRLADGAAGRDAAQRPTHPRPSVRGSVAGLLATVLRAAHPAAACQPGPAAGRRLAGRRSRTRRGGWTPARVVRSVSSASLGARPGHRARQPSNRRHSRPHPGAAGSAWSWEQIRAQAEHEGFLDGPTDPGLASWMDDGMFARWVLGELPAADELFAALRPLLTPSASRRLAHALHAAVRTAPTPAPT